MAECTNNSDAGSLRLEIIPNYGKCEYRGVEKNIWCAVASMRTLLSSHGIAVFLSGLCFPKYYIRTYFYYGKKNNKKKAIPRK